MLKQILHFLVLLFPIYGHWWGYVVCSVADMHTLTSRDDISLRGTIHTACQDFILFTIKTLELAMNCIYNAKRGYL